MLCETMKVRTIGCDCTYCTDTGILRDGERLRVGITFRDGSSGGGGAIRVLDDLSAMRDADGEAWAKSSADLNAWRDDAGTIVSAGRASPYPTVRDSQRVTANDLAALRAAADAAHDKAAEDLNAWRRE